METALTKLLGIRYPILQGGMAWTSDAELSAAVTNGGGAGIIAAGGRTPEWLAEEIRKAKTLTTGPIGVNIPMLYPNKQELLEVVWRELPAFVTLSAGKPDPEAIAACHAAGILVICVTATAKAALSAQRMGADAVVIEGAESGGHIGELSTLTLMTEVIPQMSVPVIAAGGFADGRGLAAALVMGAAGIQVGTAFMVAEECTIHPQAKARILEAGSGDVVVTGSVRKRTGAVRGIRSDFSAAYHKLEDAGGSREQLEELATGTNRLALVDGDVQNGFVMAGQDITGLKEIRPAKVILDEMMAQAREALAAGAGLLK